MSFSALLLIPLPGSLQAADATAVWAPDPMETIYDGPDYFDRNDPACEIRLAGARNGSFSGQVVVCYKSPAPPPAVRVGDLRLAAGKVDPGAGGADSGKAEKVQGASGGRNPAGAASGEGAATIPASAIQVRYALPTGVNGIQKLPAGCRGIFDALADFPPQGEATTYPVWITVNVPPGAAAGDYEGKISVAGRDVTVRISVAAWTLPDPADFATFVDFIESPESVALRYEVPLWSDRHFELIGTCFRLLAQVGNKTLYIPLAGKSNLGNEHTMIRWIRAGGKKEFKHDFSPFEKYIDAALRNGLKPKVVIAHVYEDFYGGSQGKDGLGGVLVDLLDPATGKVETMEGPGHNNAIEGWENYPEDHYNFWKSVFDGMLERMKARGIGEDALGLGLSRDMMPGKPTIENLKKAAPSAGWVSHAHGLRFGLHGMRGACCTTVWNARFPRSPEERLYGWRRKEVALHNDRDIWKPEFPSQLVRSRILGEINIAGQQRGFGRMSADFWPCLKGRDGKISVSIASRFPKSDWVQLNLRQTPYLYPGPNGALSTIRFEMMREGLQECEARIFIEKALLDAEAKKKIGGELAAKCQNLLDERVGMLLASIRKEKAEGLAASDAGAFVKSGWRDKSAALFAAAADVAAVTK